MILTLYFQILNNNMATINGVTEISQILQNCVNENQMTALMMSMGRVLPSKQGVPSVSVLFPETCLFCEKKTKRMPGTNTSQKFIFEYLTKCVTKTSESSIKTAAQVKGDDTLLKKNQGQDLIAREASYHSSCQRNYTRGDPHKKSRSEANEETRSQHTAHENAFHQLCDYIKQSIIINCNVERVTMLKEKYLDLLRQEDPKFYNIQDMQTQRKVDHFLWQSVFGGQSTAVN